MYAGVKSKIRSCRIDPTYTRLDSEQVAENGVLKRKSLYRVYDFTSDKIGSDYRNFCLENLIALGNPDLFKEVKLPQVNVEKVVENLQNLNDNVQVPQKKQGGN